MQRQQFWASLAIGVAMLVAISVLDNLATCFMPAGLMLLAAASALRFAERGAFGLSGYIAWKDFASYQWAGNDRPTLQLMPRTNLPFFAPLPWAILPEKKEAVERLLAQLVTPPARRD